MSVFFQIKAAPHRFSPRYAPRKRPGQLSHYTDWATPGWTAGILLLAVSKPVLGRTQPLIKCVPGAPSPGVNRPKREAEHSPPSIGDVRNTWSYTSTPPYVFMAWCLIKHRIRRLHRIAWYLVKHRNNFALCFTCFWDAGEILLGLTVPGSFTDEVTCPLFVGVLHSKLRFIWTH